jgi:hypothetical protein
MAYLDHESTDRLMSLIDSSYDLSCVLTLVAASSPPGELSSEQMDVVTILSHKILTNIAEMKEILAKRADYLTD